tara:strand:- start:18001 stop:19311 length:1311 start_codon:yes stop_codon:yes gene_type:complete
MKKTKFISLENLIYLYPFCFINPNFFLFLENPLLNKLRFDHFITYYLGIYIFLKFSKNSWKPNYKTLLVSIFIIFHVVKGIFLTDFSSSDFIFIKFIGYLESYISFIIIILFIDFYYFKYPLKIKSTLINFIKYFIISSFFVLSIVILFYLYPTNLNFIKLFSSYPEMVKRTFNVGRYIGPISQPIESGFYSGFGILICLIVWKFKYLNKILIALCFLNFNLIGFFSGSKAYLIATIIFMMLTLIIYFKTRLLFYASLLIGFVFFHLSVSAISTFYLVDTKLKNYPIYNVKYYDLRNYSSNQSTLKLISGGRIKIKSKENIEKESTALKNIDQSKKYFEYQGPLDGQIKMIEAHGDKLSLFFLYLLYIYICYAVIKIYLFSDMVGIFLIAITFFIFLTSLGFPIFFANKIFLFSCLVIQFIFLWINKITNYKLTSV